MRIAALVLIAALAVPACGDDDLPTVQSMSDLVGQIRSAGLGCDRYHVDQSSGGGGPDGPPPDEIGGCDVEGERVFLALFSDSEGVDSVLNWSRSDEVLESSCPIPEGSDYSGLPLAVIAYGENWYVSVNAKVVAVGEAVEDATGGSLLTVECE